MGAYALTLTLPLTTDYNASLPAACLRTDRTGTWTSSGEGGVG